MRTECSQGTYNMLRSLKNERKTSDDEHIAAQPEYRDRPATTSVALFRAFHLHILDIVKYIPDAGERYVEGSSGRTYTFNQLVHLIVSHTGEHLDEIWEIRRKHGK